jgi:hypothetical protein
LANVILQAVARAERRVEGVVSPELLRATLPAWRRAAERATFDIAVAGESPADAAAFTTKTVAENSPTLLLIDERQLVAATGSPTALVGVWSSHPALVAIALRALNAPS